MGRVLAVHGIRCLLVSTRQFGINGLSNHYVLGPCLMLPLRASARMTGCDGGVDGMSRKRMTVLLIAMDVLFV